MKKIFCISLAVLYIIALSACVDRQGASPSSAVPEASVSAAGPAADAQTSSGSIIAESSNTVSDKEIESMLDDLSAELDKAFNDAQSLEELDDSDLDVSNIE